jgi:recombinase
VVEVVEAAEGRTMTRRQLEDTLVAEGYDRSNGPAHLPEARQLRGVRARDHPGEDAGLHRAYKGGKHYGAAPYGYQTDEHRRLQVVPEEAEIVRVIIGNVADGSSLYAEAKRLNGLGIPTPGWRYGNGKKRPGAKTWSVTTVSNIVHQSAYSGVHKVKTNGGRDLIEQAVPPILDDSGLQDRAAEALKDNTHYPDHAKDRRYLLQGLVKCATCGAACTGTRPPGGEGARRAEILTDCAATLALCLKEECFHFIGRRGWYKGWEKTMCKG